MSVTIADTSMVAVAPVAQDVSSLITDALQQQAAQFETIVNGFRDQLSSLTIGIQAPVVDTGSGTAPTKQKKSKKTAPKTSEAFVTPARNTPRPSTGTSTSKTPKNHKSPKTPKTSTPTRRRHPLQVLISETPKDFQSCKEALFVHIKMMWGLFRPNDVPTTPDAALLQEFYLRFNSSEEIETVVNDPAARALVGQEQILTLKNARAAGLARSLTHIDQIYILYIHGILAKVGIRVWGPDLNDVPDSLFNAACRITALNTFRQLLAGGAYNYMNVNLKYADAMPMLFSAYNHYVHYFMTNKFKMEVKCSGKVAKQNSKKSIQKNRGKLRNERREFLLRHRAKFPARYREIVEDIAAHSDDERIPGQAAFAIKTLGYRSNNANKFFRRLDVEMLKEEQVSGKKTRHRVRKLPKVPQPSEFLKAPTNLAIDFYDAEWFNSLSAGQKRITACSSKVAFLPNASDSLKPRQHPDERLGDVKFCVKYLDILSEPYELSEDEDNDVDDDDDEEDESDGDIDIDLAATAQADEEESEFFSEGDHGDLYNSADPDSEEDSESGDVMDE